jgi:tetratricopeptide (TPR) repeat protein
MDPLKVFYAYARVDSSYRAELDKHLFGLRNRGLITDFYDGDIEGGEDWDHRIRTELERADLILILVSSDFLNSSYGTGVEIARALQRHEERSAYTIPILIRPVFFKDTSIWALQALPRNGIAVNVWTNRDAAWASVAAELEHLIEGLRRNPLEPEKSREESISSAALRIPREPAVPFVERKGSQGQDLVVWISEQLKGPTNPVLALWGAGGVGKTTLAAKIARGLIAKFGGRVAWLSADGRDITFGALIEEVGKQLGCPKAVLDRDPSTRARQVATLVSNRPALIVLDNVETIAPEEADRCVWWLSSQLRSPVLLTTRDRLARVCNVPLQSMTPEEAQQFVSGLLQQTQYPEAIRQHADSMIAVSEANPLVLQWIVGQVDLAQDPADVFDELAHGEGDAAKRVFDRSFNLPQTGDDGRSLLFALATFPDAASRSSLASVSGFNGNIKRVNTAIARLASLRLIGFAGGLHRIRIEGLTRELAEAKLASGGLQKEYQKRFIDYFKVLAEKHDGGSPDDHQVLAAELGNIKAAILMAHAMKADDAVFSMTGTVASPATGILVTQDQWREAARLSEQALNLARETRDRGAVQFFGHYLGAILVAQGEVLNAAEPLAESLQAAESNQDEYNAALTLIELATSELIRGHQGAARSIYQKSLKLAAICGNTAAMGVSLHQLGVVAQQAGDLDEARSLFVESLKIKQSQPESVSMARTLMSIGALAEIEGALEDAKRAYGFAVEILKRLRSPAISEPQQLFERVCRQMDDRQG